MRAADRFEGLLKGVATLNGWVAVILFAALTLVVSLQVFTRFILHTPFIWSEELARFLFFWVVLLGSSISVRQRRHFVIDLSMGGGKEKPASRGKARVFLDFLPDLCILAFSLLLLWQGAGYVEVGLLRVAPNSQVNMALVYAAIPVFAGLSALYSVGNLLIDVGRMRDGGSGAPEGGAGGANGSGERG